MKSKYQTKQNQKKDKDFYLMVEVKSERLVAALYLVSNFFSDTEPMKWKFRDIGLSILGDVSKLKDSKIMERTDILSRTLGNVITIISLLEIARLSDFISDMNYGILRREFVSFLNLIRTRDEIRESMDDLELTDDFFNMAQSTVVNKSTIQDHTKYQQHKSVATQPNIEAQHSFPTKPKATIKTVPTIQQRTQTGVTENNQPKIAPTTMPSLPPKEVSVSPATFGKETQSHKQEEREVSPHVTERKNYRRNVILDVLRTKQELSIKDISNIVTDCSEKTIQRELLGMVEEGMLKKKGERRWSRYSLQSV